MSSCLPSLAIVSLQGHYLYPYSAEGLSRSLQYGRDVTSMVRSAFSKCERTKKEAIAIQSLCCEGLLQEILKCRHKAKLSTSSIIINSLNSRPRKKTSRQSANKSLVTAQLGRATTTSATQILTRQRFLCHMGRWRSNKPRSRPSIRTYLLQDRHPRSNSTKRMRGRHTDALGIYFPSSNAHNIKL